MTNTGSQLPADGRNKEDRGIDDRAAEARRILERVERESETVGTSSMVRSTERFTKSLSGIDGTTEDNDPIEVLGKRIGRTLGWLALVALVVYLAFTYVL